MAKHFFTLTFQLGEAANSVGVFSTQQRAIKYAHSNFLLHLMSCGAAEYGEAALKRYQSIIARADLALKVRKPDPDELWIDLKGADGDTIQPAIFTVTKLPLDPVEEESDDEPLRALLHQASKTVQ